MINTILFDLDGTLLPLDAEEFMRAYFKGLVKKMAPYNIEPNVLIGSVWAGTEKMVKNDGRRTNEEVFWECFVEAIGHQKDEIYGDLEDFYINDFKEIKSVARPTPYARECVDILKAKGYNLVLATNPLFPKQATLHRIEWAGLKPEDFDLITTYEESHFCKPNTKYYEEVLEKMNKDVSECLMVGNDVQEDVVVMKMQMDCYLVTDCIINRDGDPLPCNHGTFKEFIEEIKTWPDIK